MMESQKIQSINNIGWDGVDATNEPIQIINREKQRELNIAFKRCFSTKDGETVLSFLKEVTLNQPCWVAGADVSFGYAREGQNSIIREIEQRIRRANEPN